VISFIRKPSLYLIWNGKRAILMSHSFLRAFFIVRANPKIAIRHSVARVGGYFFLSFIFYLLSFIFLFFIFWALVEVAGSPVGSIQHHMTATHGKYSVLFFRLVHTAPL
jgi:hypothetical protein